MRRILAIITIALLSACSMTSKTQIIERITFPAHEYEALNKTGNATVSGQVFMKTRGGDIKYGAGSKVWLNPKTSYSDQWYSVTLSNRFQVDGLGFKKLSDADSRLSGYIIDTQADGFGNFTFNNVPAGEYYLTSGVTWEAPGGSLQGGLVVKLVSVNDGDNLKIMLTR
ncbi:hypothetical protein [Vibrio vulnificus]|uniref:hypothetical protein n=1 Tax=Vibrio vulnificus TaxID=672 RepID=UPI001FAEAC7E|nr:hypothetical protein [Vibrio vulnificus]MCJ0804021.1 hypothetical protein [Vibrio vulnificus]